MPRLCSAVAATALLLLLGLCTLLGPVASSRALLARPPDPPSTCDSCRRVTGNGVRVRVGPFTTDTALGEKFKGDKVTSTCTTFLGTCGHDWEEIEYQGRTAYMAAEFLEPCD
ncbi:bacteriophage peptidoglycan hydrolase family [Chlorella sorokiniana]|uniref:Bacteriophage peptidoglycan hydrolase family n=1 Tax=Chlorella sorokiniana TaxID=3076 RepID=A0A2P6TN65_CHLSO|nr:bacteriophage peptidoglycan hydrolase family [Chlorella sorokiniana]|eukprot:PRW50776.1 bacteriophage peptidoglycan hydrolase family [Chlorella sorokiniana]